MTNYEKIKNMSVEDMAEYILYLGNGTEYCYGHCIHQNDKSCSCFFADEKYCIHGVTKWLESEVEEE